MQIIPYTIVSFLVVLFLRPYQKYYSRHENVVLFGQRKIDLPIVYSCVVIAYFVYILFAVFRLIDIGVGGTDAVVYKNNFDAADKGYFELLKSQGFEYGFNTIVWLFRQLTDNYRVMLWVWHSISFILTLIYFRNVKLDKYSFVVSIVIVFELFNQFNTLRQSLAIAMSYLVMVLLSKNRYILSVIFLVITILLHTSGFILVPVLLLNVVGEYTSMSNQIKRYVVFSSVGIFITVLLTGFVKSILSQSEKYYVYVQSVKLSVPIASTFFISVILILSMIEYEKLIKNNRMNKVIIWSLPVFYVGVILQIAVPIMYRTILYFLPYAISLIPSLIECYSDRYIYFEKVKKKLGIKRIVMLGLYLILLYKVYDFFVNSIPDVGLPYVIDAF